MFFSAPPAGANGKQLLSHCQSIAIRYTVQSLVVVFAVWWACFNLIRPVSEAYQLQNTGRLTAFVVRCFFPVGVYYLFSIMLMALRRGGDPSAVLGQRSGYGWEAEVAARHLQNTTEQMLLLLISSAVVSTTLQPHELTVLPATVSLWITGRILFLMGYRQLNPMGREFGFDLTMFTSIAQLAFAAYRMFM
jgi:hypothetical protein